MYENVDYKLISFTREDGIFIILKVIFNDPLSVDENFLVLAKDDVDSTAEIKLFDWIQNQRYTINEFNFFALNNNLCMKVKNKDGIDITSYGICTLNSDRIFGLAFGYNFK